MEQVSVVRLPAQFENVLSEYSSWTGVIPRGRFLTGTSPRVVPLHRESGQSESKKVAYPPPV